MIDGDALKEKIEQSDGEGTIARYCKMVLAECLDNDAPTIDAIPVAWLEHMMTATTLARTSNAIKDVLVLWKRTGQKEQEVRGT